MFFGRYDNQILVKTNANWFVIVLTMTSFGEFMSSQWILQNLLRAPQKGSALTGLRKGGYFHQIKWLFNFERIKQKQYHVGIRNY